MNNERYKYHHIGLPTKSIRKNEEYNQEWKFHASGYFESQFGIEWLRFEEYTPIHPLIKNIPHVAFVVTDLAKAILGKKIIYGPNSPAEGVVVCFVEENGAPIEFLQFKKPENEIWPTKHKLFAPVHSSKKWKNPLELQYHHFGICTELKKEAEQYSKEFQFHCTDHEAHPYRIQWMRYEKNCRLPGLVKEVSHIAFQVNNLEKAIEGKQVIIEPNSPSEGVRVAFIEENGAPIEFLQIDD